MRSLIMGRAGRPAPDPIAGQRASGMATRVGFALLAVALLGTSACSMGPRAVSVPAPGISYAELGQDVPNDRAPAAPQAVVRCADLLHQNRPGGSDYDGPPVPGCRRTYW
jgi:hypothetical protein